MDKKTLAKLAILAKKDPTVAEALSRQAEAVSDEELEGVAGGDVCVWATCVLTSSCVWRSDLTNQSKYCNKTVDDLDIESKFGL